MGVDLPSRLTITDDGDEQVFIHLDGELLFILNHEDDGWDGMNRLLSLTVALAQKLGVEVDDRQDIV